MPTLAGPAPIDHISVATTALTIAAISTEHIHIAARASIEGQDADPGTLPARIAVPVSSQSPNTWYDATWELLPDAALTFKDSAGIWHSWPGPVHAARVLLGSDGGVLALTAGAYDLWVEIDLADETVRRPAGTLEVT